jgi:riboflavin kinase/FMN adenylyltransferase
LYGLEDLPGEWEGCVATIGAFDGVHRGHQKVISRAIVEAVARAAPPVVLTFEPDPAQLRQPASHPPVLTTADRKAELLADLGVDLCCAVPLTADLARLSAEEFAWQVLLDRLHAAAVVVGANFSFGYQARGSAATLAGLGERLGFAVATEGLVTTGEPATERTAVSSTYIRTRIETGDVAAAAAALGRPHRVAGEVVHGDGRGSELGYPTANVSAHPLVATPADGVYACWLQRAGAGPARAAVSIGTNPTFAGHERRVEAYLLDTSPDLYGLGVGLDFVTRIRGMARFGSTGELVRQMQADVAATRALLSVP